MKTIKIGKNTYTFIEVPNDARNFRYDSWCTRYIVYDESGSITPDFNSKIITTTNSITEEIAKNVIEKSYYQLDYYKNYNVKSISSIDRAMRCTQCETALESFYSLMDSLELDRSKNYLLIEKLNK